MSDEDAFLAAVRAHPADDTARLVFADWLDERGDLESAGKAAYLRAEVEMSAKPADDPARDGLILHLWELAAALPRGWAASVAKVNVENCGVPFEFVCPKTWDRMRATNDPNVRHCEACRKNVYFCETIKEARELGACRGECVAIHLRVPRMPGDLDPPRSGMTVGVVMFEPESQPPAQASWLTRMTRLQRLRNLLRRRKDE